MKYSYNLINSFLKKKISLEKMVETITIHIGEVEYFQVDKDYCLDVDVPANRYTDLGSHFGLAKDLCLILKIDFVDKEENNIVKKDVFKLDVKTDECNAYVGTLIKNADIKESAKFIQEALNTCGLRPINNLVDITNFVMLEYGQPMHVFDYDKIDTGIVVKKSKGEKFVTLDDREIELDKTCMVISDFKDSLAIAGIKGGKKAEVDGSTKNLILESANFDAHSIYLCSKKINLRTDASSLYIHDLSIKLAKKATKRALWLLEKYCGIDNCGTTYYIKDVEENKLVLNLLKLNHFAGYLFEKDFVKYYLDKNDFDYSEIENGYYVEIPEYRKDLKCEQDLYADIIRVFGFSNIPYVEPSVKLKLSSKNDYYVFKNLVKDIFVSFGFNEIYSYAFLNDHDLDFVNCDVVELRNYLSEENKYMTCCLYLPMLKAVSFNYINYPTGKLFEIDKVFEKKGKDILQKDLLGFTLYNDKKDDKKDLVLEAKGIISSMLEKLGISDDLVEYSISKENSIEEKNMSFDIFVSSKKIMKMYVFDSLMLKEYSIKTERKDVNCVVVECLVEGLFEITKKEIEFNPIPKYQASIRDISLNVAKDLMVGDIYVLIRSIGLEYLEDIDLFDVYENDSDKSVSFHLVFRADDHTLTAEEIDGSMDKIYEVLNKNNIKIR